MDKISIYCMLFFASQKETLFHFVNKCATTPSRLLFTYFPQNFELCSHKITKIFLLDNEPEAFVVRGDERDFVTINCIPHVKRKALRGAPPFCQNILTNPDVFRSILMVVRPQRMNRYLFLQTSIVEPQEHLFTDHTKHFLIWPESVNCFASIPQNIVNNSRQTFLSFIKTNTRKFCYTSLNKLRKHGLKKFFLLP